MGFFPFEAGFLLAAVPLFLGFFLGGRDELDPSEYSPQSFDREVLAPGERLLARLRVGLTRFRLGAGLT